VPAQAVTEPSAPTRGSHLYDVMPS
jgi:hypothetical protein